jgi:hypothetical protein
MTKPPLMITDDMTKRLEKIRLKYQAGVSNLRKAWLVNEVASALNSFWKDQVTPALENKPWKNSIKFLQDIIGDESKNYRMVNQWLKGEISTKKFIDGIAYIIQAYLEM